jgi:mxaL protein
MWRTELFKRFGHYLWHRRDAAMLATAFVLVLAAAFKPTVPIPRNIYSYVFVVDISQSMNVKGMYWHGKEVSRLDYTKSMLHDIIGRLPCGSRVSISLFAGVSVAALYTPIEVCANYSAIQDTIDHMEWRMAWSGNSRLRDSTESLSRLLRAMPEASQVVFFTDGEEAPKLHAFNTRDLSTFQGGGWLMVGIGSMDPHPIPKMDESNKVIGYWSAENFTMQPGIAQISQQNFGNRDDNVAPSENDRYASRLDEEYLQQLSKEIHATYVRGDSLQAVRSAMSELKPSRRDFSPMQIDWILATLAGIAIIGAYTPQRLIHLFRRLRAARAERRQRGAGSADVRS